MLKIRTKVRILLAIWIISEALLLLGAMYLTPYFLIPLFTVLGLLGYYSMSIRCPNCQKPVLFNPKRFLKREIYIWTPKIPDSCTKCGTKLT
jgi:hypothetical protein